MPAPAANLDCLAQMTPASIVIPTRERLSYLEVALASIAPAAAQAGAEVLVVDDGGPSPAARELAARFGARYEPHPAPLGLNVARNTGVERSHGVLSPRFTRSSRFGVPQISPTRLRTSEGCSRSRALSALRTLCSPIQ